MGVKKSGSSGVCLWVVVTTLVVNGVAARQLHSATAEPAGDAAALQSAITAAAASSWRQSLLSDYLSNEQLAQWSLDFTMRCAKISRRFSIGKSVTGLDLWVVEIAANPGKVEAKPNFKYVANMHGDEPGGRMLLPMLAEWLCSSAGQDARASRIINGMHLFLMPTMNPDGFARRQRYNAAGVDLNRDFPSPFLVCKDMAPEACDASRMGLSTNTRVAPETAAIMAWSLDPSFPFTASANLHEGAVVVNYPWDGYPSGSTAVTGVVNPTSEQAAFTFLAKTYASKHPWMHNSAFFTDGITNGAGWYPIYGSMQDFDYTAAGCMDLTLELSQEKYPAASTLAGQWADNLDALLALPITAVLGGVSGQVTDSRGAPIRGAVVTVDGILMKAAARGAFAYYNKPLAPGSYTVRVKGPGYRPASATVTVPGNGQGVKHDFKLQAMRKRQILRGAPAAVADREHVGMGLVQG